MVSSDMSLGGVFWGLTGGEIAVTGKPCKIMGIELNILTRETVAKIGVKIVIK